MIIVANFQNKGVGQRNSSQESKKKTYYLVCFFLMII